jgi:hypothetical protein
MIREKYGMTHHSTRTISALTGEQPDAAQSDMRCGEFEIPIISPRVGI